MNKNMKILVYPVDPNPYQHTLYRELERYSIDSIMLGPATKSVSLDLLIWYARVLIWRLRGVSVFHLHWVAFSLTFHSGIAHWISFINSVIALTWIKLLGFKLIWTVHNIVPHEQQTIDDVFVTRYLLHIADHVIIHSAATVSQCHQLGLTVRDYTIIPPGNFIGTYPDANDTQISRKFLELPAKATVFLFVGQIRTYKGVDHLIRAFGKLHQKYPNSFLLIQGSCPVPAYQRQVEKLAGSHSAIRLLIQYIPDGELQTLVEASDIIVLPFRSLATSSSALLALSMKKPLIAPRLGSLTDLPDSVGIFYDAEDVNGLLASMIKAMNSRAQLAEMGIRGYRFVRRHNNWREIARKTQQVYRRK